MFFQISCSTFFSVISVDGPESEPAVSIALKVKVEVSPVAEIAPETKMKAPLVTETTPALETEVVPEVEAPPVAEITPALEAEVAPEMKDPIVAEITPKAPEPEDPVQILQSLGLREYAEALVESEQDPVRDPVRIRETLIQALRDEEVPSHLKNYNGKDGPIRLAIGKVAGKLRNQDFVANFGDRVWEMFLGFRAQIDELVSASDFEGISPVGQIFYEKMEGSEILPIKVLQAMIDLEDSRVTYALVQDRELAETVASASGKEASALLKFFQNEARKAIRDSRWSRQPAVDFMDVARETRGVMRLGKTARKRARKMAKDRA